MNVDEDAQFAADHDLVWADWDVMTDRVMSIMSAHLPIAKGRLLDATCRTGMGCDAARRMGWEVVGADPSPAMLDRARMRLPDAEFYVGDVCHLFETVDQSTDAVVAIGDGLAAVAPEQLDLAFDELRRCTRLGGSAMVVVRDFSSLRSAVWRDDPVCKVTGLFVTRPDGWVEHTLQVEDADGTREHTHRVYPYSEIVLRDAMDASGYHVRRTAKMLGRVVLSGIAI